MEKTMKKPTAKREPVTFILDVQDNDSGEIVKSWEVTMKVTPTELKSTQLERFLAREAHRLVAETFSCRWTRTKKALDEVEEASQ